MAKGKPVIDRERCKGCGMCIVNCPQKILTMTEDFNSQGVTTIQCIDNEKCTTCCFCAIMCPESAIDIYAEEARRV